jgi:fumarate reductase iron-sulfur subunit
VTSTAAGEVLEVSVWRGPTQGRFEVFEVPARESQSVLDVVTWIQRHLDPTLAYRFACRVGMCGSCAMTVNGTPRWTCRTHVGKVARDGRIRIEPLANLPVIKDLSVDMSEFFDKWSRARARFEPGRRPRQEFATIRPDSRERRLAEAGMDCIGCGVCYAACDVVAWNAEYLGPAALNRAWTLLNDVRDAGDRERVRAVAGNGGCHACHTQQGCTEWCPRHLSPTAGIAGLKRAAARALLKGQL